jgi:hypothetical protein
MLIRPIAGGLVAAMLVWLTGCGGSSFAGAGLGAIGVPVPPTHAEAAAPRTTSEARVQSWMHERVTNLGRAQGEGSSVPAGLGKLGIGSLTSGPVAPWLHYAYERDCAANIGAPFGDCNGNGVVGESVVLRTPHFSPYSLVAGGAGTALGIALRTLAPRVAGVSIGPGGIVVSGRF